jgi:DNA-binding NarL/FixJ family response regulator
MSKKNEKLRILIADDHYIVRMGLAALINSEAEMEVVGAADDGAQALEMFGRLRPDVVLLDCRMPGKSGVETAVEMLARNRAVRILMLSAFDGSEDIHRAIEAGVHGYLLKRNASGKELIAAVRTVASGQNWIPKEVAGKLASRKSLEGLTARELEVLNELAKGLANKEIADKLNISEYTVKDHLKHILYKLKVADRTEAVTTAIQRGIIEV